MMRLFLITYMAQQTVGYCTETTVGKFYFVSSSVTMAQTEGRSELARYLKTEAFSMEVCDVLDQLQTVDAHLLPFLGEWAHKLTAAVDAAKEE